MAWEKGGGGGGVVDCLILGEWLQDMGGGGGDMDFDLQKFLDIGGGRKGGGMGTDFDLHFVDVRGMCVYVGGGGGGGVAWTLLSSCWMGCCFDVADGTPIAVSHSSNVFMERLVDMKELETPMYVTNNQQTQDFVWHRESGIDIVVGISGVFLIPEYRELDVEDDSQYFLTQSMEAQSTLDLYSRTKKHYCR